MPVNIREKIRKLSAAQRKKVEDRANIEPSRGGNEFARPPGGPQAHASPCRQGTRYHPRQRLATRKAHRSFAFNGYEKRSGQWAVTCASLPNFRIAPQSCWPNYWGKILRASRPGSIQMGEFDIPLVEEINRDPLMDDSDEPL